VPFI
jgi:hypothetical protein